MSTGKANINDMGQLFDINGKAYIDGECWEKSSPCATISGTDGIIYPPTAGETRNIRLFAPELNRSIGLDYELDTTENGLSARKFVWSNNTFKSGAAYPPNKCFSNPKNKFSQYSGVLFNSKCNFNIPLAFSSPHFYNSDSFFGDMFEGLKPSKDKHESSIELNQNGELTLGKKRLQVNIDTEFISKQRKFKRYVFPLFWLSETTRNIA